MTTLWRSALIYARCPWPQANGLSSHNPPFSRIVRLRRWHPSSTGAKSKEAQAGRLRARRRWCPSWNRTLSTWPNTFNLMTILILRMDENKFDKRSAERLGSSISGLTPFILTSDFLTNQSIYTDRYSSAVIHDWGSFNECSFWKRVYNGMMSMCCAQKNSLLSENKVYSQMKPCPGATPPCLIPDHCWPLHFSCFESVIAP